MESRFNTYLEQDLIRRVKVQAVREEISPAKLITKALEQYLALNEQKK